MFILAFQTVMPFVMRFYCDDVSGWLSPIRCSVLYLFLCQQRSVDKDATFLSSWNIWRLHSSVLTVMSSYWCWCRARTADPWSCNLKRGNDILIHCALSEYALCILCACALMSMQTLTPHAITFCTMKPSSFILKWEFIPIFILVVSHINCCKLQHLEHVF